MVEIKQDSSPLSYKLVYKAAIASVTVASLLIFIKALTWWYTDAISLKASLMDSLLDAAASLINLFAIKKANQPANKHFRFGYGKLEAISALGQSVFIAVSACWLIVEAGERFLYPTPIRSALWGMYVMILAMFITFLLLIYQHHVVKITRSAAIRADSLHYRSDFLINGGVLLSLAASRFFEVKWIDSLTAGLTGLYIFYTAWTIARDGFYILMDHELSHEERQRIIKLALSHPAVKGLHDLRTRSSGMKRFIQLHLELSGDLTLSQAHALADEVEEIILKEFKDAEVLIHQDPEGLEERHKC